MSTRPDPWVERRASVYGIVGFWAAKLLAPASVFTTRLEPSRIPAIWAWDFYVALLLVAMMFVAEHRIRRAWRRWQTGS
ncbi:MAG TPA: hypothetical protein VGH23_10950 [Rhizomicrobium sp.]|jgi:hypothetical protein